MKKHFDYYEANKRVVIVGWISKRQSCDDGIETFKDSRSSGWKLNEWIRFIVVRCRRAQAIAIKLFMIDFTYSLKLKLNSFNTSQGWFVRFPIYYLFVINLNNTTTTLHQLWQDNSTHSTLQRISIIIYCESNSNIIVVLPFRIATDTEGDLRNHFNNVEEPKPLVVDINCSLISTQHIFSVSDSQSMKNSSNYTQKRANYKFHELKIFLREIYECINDIIFQQKRDDKKVFSYLLVFGCEE
jgi:hypothetical protein